MPEAPAATGSAPIEETIQWLEHAILSGELKPGDRVPESVLAARFGVGRGPLREALRTLEGRRLLERTPFSGVRVAELSIDDLEQLLITREALEGMAARQAAEVMTLPETRRLRELLNASKAAGDLGEFFRRRTQDNDFHTQIVRGSRNHWLAEFLCRDLYALLNICRFRAASVPQRMKAVHGEHERILEAIEQRDPELAERRMREHVAHGRESLLRRLRETQAQEQASSRRARPAAREPT
ncbi:Carbon starvation induced regulator [Variovorax sp. SRS16]|uniref:GntR family transcriptional regulator n=1 Tax=Variovorax sp. SRS16 TaxID=282217 RepID=UPI0013183EEE|nr:GntR family transcriptional regulator [Variovorax sp. SRS16]VTU32449.1 Carbon starvation induced regulator [Variovorax sp. SRS16]